MGIYKYIRIGLVLIPIVALGVFGYRYINPSGVLEFSYNFCHKETAYFSGLSPAGRVLEIKKSEIRSASQRGENPKSKIGVSVPGPSFKEKVAECFQEMVIDPIYFDVRLPQSYRQVEMEILMDKEDGQDFRIGVAVDPKNWQWAYADAVDCESRISVNCYSLDLVKARFANNRYRFIISAPGLVESGSSIYFNSLHLKFEKEPLTVKNLLDRIKSFINRFSMRRFRPTS